MSKKIVGVVDTCERIIKARVILHSFLQCEEDCISPGQRHYCPPQYTDVEDANCGIIPGFWRANGLNLRSKYKFQKSSMWQLKRVCRGAVPL